MTTDVLPQAAETAHALHQEVMHLRRSIERDFLALAARLARIRDERLYAALGHSTFNSYLADPEVGLAHSTAFQLLRVHDVAMLRGWSDAPEHTDSEPLITVDEALAIGLKKTDLIRRKLIDAATPAERQVWKDKAMENSVADLRKELAEARGVDVDAAWRADAEHCARRLFGLAGRLMEVADSAAALVLLDEVCATAMKARGELERQR